MDFGILTGLDLQAESRSQCLSWKKREEGAAERGSKELQSFQLNFNSLKNIVAIHLDSPRAFLFMKEWSSVIFLDVD